MPRRIIKPMKKSLSTFDRLCRVTDKVPIRTESVSGDGSITGRDVKVGEMSSEPRCVPP